MDLTVRNEEGDIINSDKIGTVELYRDHQCTVERNKQREEEVVESQRVTIAPPQIHTLNLHVSVCNVICRAGDEVDVIMSLYDSREGKFFRCLFCMKIVNRIIVATHFNVVMTALVRC